MLEIEVIQLERTTWPEPEEDIGRAIAALWAIAWGAAFVQSFYPEWVTPDCPRVVIDAGRTIHEVQYVVPVSIEHRDGVEEFDGSIVAYHTHVRTLRTEVHIHREEIGINLGCPLDGRWSFGIGFLYHGPDPENGRWYHGTVYCWFIKRMVFDDRIY